MKSFIQFNEAKTERKFDPPKGSEEEKLKKKWLRNLKKFKNRAEYYSPENNRITNSYDIHQDSMYFDINGKSMYNGTGKEHVRYDVGHAGGWNGPAVTLEISHVDANGKYLKTEYWGPKY